MIPLEIMRLIRSNARHSRSTGWRKLWRARHELNLGPQDFEILHDLAWMEDETTITAFATGLLHQLELRYPRPSLQSVLWESFQTNVVSPQGYRAPAVFAVCDAQYIRDAYPLLQLAQWLPNARELRFELLHQSEDWKRLQLGSMKAICLVGRPSLHCGFPLSSLRPKDLRFEFPSGDAKWRGKPVTRPSIRQYHHVIQRWERADPILHKVVENKAARTDYAIVQRFPIRSGGNRVDVIILAGATSLGTAGAVRWATRGYLDEDILRRFPGDASRIEVLLKVTAPKERPPRLWCPREDVQKLFVGRSPNLISRAELITLVGGAAGPNRVRSILLDHDGVHLSDDERAALIALCLKAHQQRVADIDALFKDASVWPGGVCIRNDQDQLKQFYVDHFHKKLLNGCLHLDQRNLHIHADIVLT